MVILNFFYIFISLYFVTYLKKLIGATFVFVVLLLADNEGDLNDVLRERMNILSIFIDIFIYYKQQILICLEKERKENRNILLRLLMKNIDGYLIFIEKPSSK